jgi:hypothetical protein
MSAHVVDHDKELFIAVGKAGQGCREYGFITNQA